MSAFTEGSEPLLRRLSPAVLADLDQALASFDRGLPANTLAISGEAALFAFTFADPDQREAEFRALKTAPFWRQGFSKERAAADHVVRALKLGEQIEKLDRGPAALEALDTAVEALVETRNPMTLLALPNIQSAVRARRETLNRVRVLRMIAAHARGNDIEPLPDAHGGNLHHTITDGTLRVFSDHDARCTHTYVR